MRGEFECLRLLRKSEPQNIEQGISNDEVLFWFCRAAFLCSSEQRNAGNIDSSRSWPNKRLREDIDNA
jgi:hypothetical protein